MRRRAFARLSPKRKYSGGRAGVATNPNTPPPTLTALANNKNEFVRKAIAKNKSFDATTESHSTTVLSEPADLQGRTSPASCPSPTHYKVPIAKSGAL